MAKRLWQNDGLIEDIERGSMPVRNLARKHGIVLQDLLNVLKGRRCPSVLRLLNDLADATRGQLGRMAISTMHGVMARQLQVGIKGENETARKCREFVLLHFLLDRPPQPPPRPRAYHRGEMLPGLTARDLIRIGRERYEDEADEDGQST